MIKPDIENAVITGVQLESYGGYPAGDDSNDEDRFVVRLAWSTAEHGFGVLTLFWNPSGWKMETETLGRGFAAKVLAWVASSAKVTE